MRITAKGQVTIPHKFRVKFGLLPHTEVEFKEYQGMLCIAKVKKTRKESHRQQIIRRTQSAKINRKPN